MIKTFGEAAFSIALATGGVSPILLSDVFEPQDVTPVAEVQSVSNQSASTPVSQDVSTSTSVVNINEKIAYNTPVSIEQDDIAMIPPKESGQIPDLYAEKQEKKEQENKFERKVQSFAADLQNAYYINPTRAENFSRWILLAVESTSIPKEIMASLVVSESSFQYKLKSSVGAVGPAQVRPEFWEDACGSGDFENDPEFNIRCGSIALSEYLEDHCDGDMTCALQKYNVGPTNYYDPKYEDAKRRYISKIKRNMAKLTGNYNVLASR